MLSPVLFRAVFYSVLLNFSLWLSSFFKLAAEVRSSFQCLSVEVLIIFRVPVSTLPVSLQMRHAWDGKSSVIQKPNYLWLTPNPVQKQWSRAALIVLPHGHTPSGQLNFCQQRQSWSKQLWSQLAVGKVRGGGKVLLHSQAGEHGVMVLQLAGKVPFSLGHAGALSEPHALFWKRAS